MVHLVRKSPASIVHLWGDCDFCCRCRERVLFLEDEENTMSLMDTRPMTIKNYGLRAWIRFKLRMLRLRLFGVGRYKRVHFPKVNRSFGKLDKEDILVQPMTEPTGQTFRIDYVPWGKEQFKPQPNICERLGITASTEPNYDDPEHILGYKIEGVDENL